MTDRSLAKKIAWAQDRYDRFLPAVGDHGELHTASLNVHDAGTSIALGENRLSSRELHDSSGQAGRSQKGMRVK